MNPSRVRLAQLRLASMRPQPGGCGNSPHPNCHIVKDLAEQMRATTTEILHMLWLLGQAIMQNTENKHFRGRERPPRFLHRLAARFPHRVVKTGYSLNSPSNVFARRRA